MACLEEACSELLQWYAKHVFQIFFKDDMFIEEMTTFQTDQSVLPMLQVLQHNSES